MNTVVIEETPAQQAYRESQLGKLPWACARTAMLAVLLVVAAFYLLHRWELRLPALDWALILFAPAMVALATFISTPKIRLVFGPEALELIQSVGFWNPRTVIPWTQLRGWAFKSSLLFGPNELLVLKLSWGRRMRIPVDVSLRARITALLQQFRNAT